MSLFNCDPQSRRHQGGSYDLVVAGGHDRKVRDTEAAADKVSAGGALEQKTELFGAAVKNPHEGGTGATTPRAMAKNTARSPNRSLRDIIVPTSHAGVDMKQRLCAGIA